MHGGDFTGVTEVRAGVYMFGDLFQAEIGTHGMDAIAFMHRQARIVVGPGERFKARQGIDAGFGQMPAQGRIEGGGILAFEVHAVPRVEVDEVELFRGRRSHEREELVEGLAHQIPRRSRVPAVPVDLEQARPAADERVTFE